VALDGVINLLLDIFWAIAQTPTSGKINLIQGMACHLVKMIQSDVTLT
jgi:hypothetical protein